MASVYAMSDNIFLRMTTPVRQNLTAVTRDDARATLEMVNIQTGSETVIAVAPENPQFSVFGAARVNTPARQILVDDQNLAYSIGVSGLSVIPVFATGTAPRPANAAAATSIPAPAVLGGSCVVMNELPLPFIHTSDGRISAQSPKKRSGGCDYSAVRRLQFLLLWNHTVLPHEPDN